MVDAFRGSDTLPSMHRCLILSLGLVAVAGQPTFTLGQTSLAQPSPPRQTPRRFLFEDRTGLNGWTVQNDVAVDPSRSHAEGGGSLKVGPGGRAILPLREDDQSGQVELWVHNDGTHPENPKASRVGPRWGLLQKDGILLAVGALYAGYLGGAEVYTAVDPDKTGLQGFSAVAIWGDSGPGSGQTIWVDDLSVTLGGPVQPGPTREEADPYDDKTLAADLTLRRPAVLYDASDPPATPKLEDLPLQDRLSQYGITWTFEKPVRVGQFVNGDWYFVGPATIRTIDPRPLYGGDIPRRQLDSRDRERPEAQRVRNGFMLNPPPRMKVAYDSGVRNWFDPSLIRKLPVTMKPGDSLVSTISMPKGLVLHAPLRNQIERGEGDSSPIRTAAVLTCVNEPQPPDAFRPAFCDRAQTAYLARHLRRDLLPTAARTPSLPNVDRYVRFTQRPWVGTGFFGFEEPVENMPQYGLEYGRVAGIAALLLCTDLPAERKQLLLVNYVQVGIDLAGMIREGHPGWTCWGGHGSGRKLPIVFAGLLLGDEQLANVNLSFPQVSFGEDEQTAYGDSWTGAKVVFAGHSGIDAVSGAGRSRNSDWGPYEHLPPTHWKDGQNTSESYRRCCTSVGWVAQGLALRLLHAEPAWRHNAFFDYVDRWMFEDDASFVQTIKAATGRDHDKEWARQGQAWDAFVNEMWARHRPTLPAPTDGWKQPHDDTRYRFAVGHPGP